MSKMEVRTEGLIQPVVQPLQTKSDIFAFFFFASSHVSPSRSPAQSAPLCSVLCPEARWCRQRMVCSVKGCILHLGGEAKRISLGQSLPFNCSHHPCRIAKHTGPHGWLLKNLKTSSSSSKSGLTIGLKSYICEVTLVYVLCCLPVCVLTVRRWI